jgi:translocation and assembly module TamA
VRCGWTQWSCISKSLRALWLLRRQSITSGSSSNPRRGEAWLALPGIVTEGDQPVAPTKTRYYLAAALIALLLGHSSPTLANVNLNFDIDGGTPQMESNLRAFLSLTRYEKRDDLDADTLSRLDTRIPAEARSALEPLGYYEPQITYDVKQDGKSWQVNIKVVPGRAVRLSEVTISISGDGKDDPRIAAVLDKHDLREGRRLDHGTYDAVKGNLMRAATGNGYLDARWEKSELLIDKEQRRAYVTLQLDTGQRYRFGKIDIDQSVIKPDKMRRLLRMKEGDPYSLDALLQSQYVLDDTQYFSPAEVSAGTRDPETHTVPVVVTAKANRRNSYAISAGYGTDTQARGKLTWTDRLVNSEGHHTRLDLTGSAVGYEAAFHYIVPIRDIALEKVEFILSDTKEELDTATSYRNEFTTELTRVLGSWQRVLFTRLSQERSIYTDTTVGEEKTFLIIPGIKYTTLPTYILGQGERRYTASAELNGSPSSLGSGASWLQLILSGERIFDISELWHLRLRAQFGITLTNDFLRVPASARFYAGGDNSVRGFALNELSPTNDDNTTGGRDLLVGSFEVERDLPRNFRAAVFYDIGNAVNALSDPLEYSVGVGLRWHISIASIGIDVAQPLSVSGRTPRLHLFLSTLF